MTSHTSWHGRPSYTSHAHCSYLMAWVELSRMHRHKEQAATRQQMKENGIPQHPREAGRLPRLRSLLSLREAGGAGIHGVTHALNVVKWEAYGTKLLKGSQKEDAQDLGGIRMLFALWLLLLFCLSFQWQGGVGGTGGESMMLKLLRLSQILSVNARKHQIYLRSEEKGCKESKCGTGHLFNTDQKWRGNQHLLTMHVLYFL